MANGGTDDLRFSYFPDNTFALPTQDNFSLGNPAQIKYSATGWVATSTPPSTTQNTGAPGYKASDVSVIPLADANANAAAGPPFG